MFGAAAERSTDLHKLTNGVANVLPIDKKFSVIIEGFCCRDAQERSTIPELKKVVQKAIDELEAKVV
jgi:hypothetical protein